MASIPLQVATTWRTLLQGTPLPAPGWTDWSTGRRPRRTGRAGVHLAVHLGVHQQQPVVPLASVSGTFLVQLFTGNRLAMFLAPCAIGG